MLFGRKLNRWAQESIIVLVAGLQFSFAIVAMEMKGPSLGICWLLPVPFLVVFLKTVQSWINEPESLNRPSSTHLKLALVYLGLSVGFGAFSHPMEALMSLLMVVFSTQIRPNALARKIMKVLSRNEGTGKGL